MRKLIAVVASTGALLAFGGLEASAAYNPPPPTLSVCDAGHGAFGAFSGQGGASWIPADAREDGGLGAATGPANSGLGQACIGQQP